MTDHKARAAVMEVKHAYNLGKDYAAKVQRALQQGQRFNEYMLDGCRLRNPDEVVTFSNSSEEGKAFWKGYLSRWD